MINFHQKILLDFFPSNYIFYIFFHPQDSNLRIYLRRPSPVLLGIIIY